MIILETKRLLIKTPDESTGQSVLDFFNRNKKFLEPWMPARSEEFFTLQNQINSLREKQKLFEEEKEIRFYLFKKENPEQIIGDFGFSNIIKGAFWSCHLGYQIDKDEINKGYMAEALQAGIAYVFEKVKLHRIEANVIPRNLSSIRLMEKLGFKNEGVSEKYLKINNKWEDHIHFVMLNESVE